MERSVLVDGSPTTTHHDSSLLVGKNGAGTFGFTSSPSSTSRSREIVRTKGELADRSDGSSTSCVSSMLG